MDVIIAVVPGSSPGSNNTMTTVSRTPGPIFNACKSWGESNSSRFCFFGTMRLFCGPIRALWHHASYRGIPKRKMMNFLRKNLFFLNTYGKGLQFFWHCANWVFGHLDFFAKNDIFFKNWVFWSFELGKSGFETYGKVSLRVFWRNFSRSNLSYRAGFQIGTSRKWRKSAPPKARKEQTLLNTLKNNYWNNLNGAPLRPEKRFFQNKRKKYSWNIFFGKIYSTRHRKTKGRLKSVFLTKNIKKTQKSVLYQKQVFSGIRTRVFWLLRTTRLHFRL